MQARTEDLQTLLKLQQADFDALRARKGIEALPQRSVIATARAKKAQIEGKAAQVAELRDAAEREVSSIEEEDAALAEKQRAVQAEIDEVRGDYRSVEARTKELNGISKRRMALEEQLGEASEKLEKVEAVRQQIASALETLAREEATAVASYREEGGSLQREIEDAKARHAELVSLLPADLADRYEKTASRCGGVAVGLLNGSKCGTCRAEIPSERLIEVRKQAPLATCPSCQRMLIVTEVVQ